MNSETNKGRNSFVYKNNKFREYYRKKNGNVHVFSMNYEDL